jgi:hypothetical protein
MGSAGVAAWAAQVVFAALIVVGVLWGDLGIKRALVFAVLWIAGYFLLPLWRVGGVAGLGAAFFSPYVAVLDIIAGIGFFQDEGIWFSTAADGWRGTSRSVSANFSVCFSMGVRSPVMKPCTKPAIRASPRGRRSLNRSIIGGSSA